ncbi:MAG TPA: pseudouridine-5'-phosphate glycosidase [Anaerolineales bacterium]|jgi:pseudouridine-5'-phosphate glycosidase|nr:pseudouridine-5'-phosphate glycosidase [Anaerolineales bacterium]|tara:strand:- start:1083 stop:1997 length:915 start_codon:yes stop_codon:yes gene_type:complete
MNDSFVDVIAEVKLAIQTGKPVVALESTVIAHGLPRPQNLDTARRLQAIVRSEGAIPATVAILDGQVKIGLTDDELEVLANADQVVKVSRRDFSNVVGRGLTGATTVAGTLIAASWAGIRVMATGGIGGVHRGEEPDVSADLPEIARTPMVVVCSGAKAILDLSATLEWLETHGVPVVGYGTDDLPGFYARSSGLPLEVRADTPASVSELWDTHTGLGMTGGMVVTVPPPEKEALSGPEIQSAINQALDQAVADGVRGKHNTPYLLQKVKELTGGASLRVNIALLENNARIASMISNKIVNSDI